jgi:hypothetical protein
VLANLDPWIYPIVVVEDRYNGAYSGGEWLAIAAGDKWCERCEDVHSRVACVMDDGPHGGDIEAMVFWDKPPAWIAVGNSPDDAVNTLIGMAMLTDEVWLANHPGVELSPSPEAQEMRDG